MTQYTNSAEGGTNGTTVTTANSGGSSGQAFNYVPGAVTFDSTRAAHGSLSYKMAPTSGAACSVQIGSAASGWASTSFAARFYVYMTALPTSAYTLFRADDSSNAMAVRLNIGTDGKLILAYNNGSTVTPWTATTAIPTNTWVRVEVRIVRHASAGVVAAAFYSADATTATDSYSASSLNTGTGGIASATFGKYGTDTTATAFWIDDLAVDTATTTFIGGYTTPLGTPVVTLGTTTNPSTVGGSDGSQVVSWAAISGATGYDAYIATTLTPNQGDFTLVHAGVTSPYTFTGLSAGSYAFGIKAKA